MNHYFIIGSSRGLGAALAEELLSKGSNYVFGIARTHFEAIQNQQKLLASNRYRHVVLDITSSYCSEHLKSICSEIPADPICIIFNAALVESDLHDDNSIDNKVYQEVNLVGIKGLGNVLSAFQNHLLHYGGIFVGISSFSSLAPPIFDKRVAYPASKAYLAMTLRCLNIAWHKKVKVVTVNLGHIGGHGTDLLSRLLMPSYEMAAQKIVESISGNQIPNEINYPILHTIVYRYLINFIPDTTYFWIFRSLLKCKLIVNKIKNDP